MGAGDEGTCSNTVKSDEEQIRELVSRWTVATKSGDVDAVLELMTDDAVLLARDANLLMPV